MSNPKADVELLRRFERGLDPRFPERSAIPARVLGYGEISTVIELAAGGAGALAYKRLSMFRTVAEAQRYEALHNEYVQTLSDRVGLRVVPSELVRLVDERTGSITLYIVQEKLPPEGIGHNAIHRMSPANIRKLVIAVLRELRKVFAFNSAHAGELEVGLDGQISNWAIAGFDPSAPAPGERVELVYFDTSTPLMRKDGAEQLDPELFLRGAPSFLVWAIRLLFVKDVMARYYDFRRVAVDLVANFSKEQRPELIPTLVDAANTFFAAEIREGGFAPITAREVRAYYREDAWIWRIYLAFRKADRALHRLLGKEYRYILPGRIRR
jgi:hypothetical protein